MNDYACDHNTVPNLHSPLMLTILRPRDDGDVDLIDYRSRAGIGRYRAVHAPLGAGGRIFTFLASLLITFAVGFLLWHLGRSYGRHEEQDRPSPVEVSP